MLLVRGDDTVMGISSVLRFHQSGRIADGGKHRESVWKVEVAAHGRNYFSWRH